MKKENDRFELIKIQRQELRYLRAMCKLADAAIPVFEYGISSKRVARVEKAIQSASLIALQKREL